MKANFRRFLAVLLTVALLWTSAAPAFAEEVAAFYSNKKSKTTSEEAVQTKGTEKGSDSEEEELEVAPPVKLDPPVEEEPEEEPVQQPKKKKGAVEKVSETKQMATGDYEVEPLERTLYYTGSPIDVPNYIVKDIDFDASNPNAGNVYQLNELSLKYAKVVEGQSLEFNITSAPTAAGTYKVQFTITSLSTTIAQQATIYILPASYDVQFTKSSDNDSKANGAAYDGTDHMPTISFSKQTVGAPTLVSGDYEVQVDGNNAITEIKDAKTYQVKVVALNDNITLTSPSIDWTIAPAPVVVLWNTTKRDFLATDAKPGITSALPLASTDYEVEYYESTVAIAEISTTTPVTNFEAGKSYFAWLTLEDTVTATNYSIADSARKYDFNVVASTGDEITIEFASSVDNIIYTGAEQKPDIVVKKNGVALSDTEKANQCRITYSSNIDAGTAYVTVSPTTPGAFVEAEKNFTIKRNTLTIEPDDGQSKQYGDPDPELKYSVKTYAADLANGVTVPFAGILERERGEEVTAEGATGYRISNKNVSAGSNFIVVFSDTPVYFTITKKKVVVTKPAAGVIYDGKEKPVVVTGCDSATVTYEKNGSPVDVPVDAGTYNYTVTIDDTKYELDTVNSTGALTGESYTIAQREITDGGYSATFVDPTVYDGNEHVPAFALTGVNSNLELVEGKDYTVSYTKGGQPVDAPIVDAGTYSAKVTLKTDGNYYSTITDIGKSFTIEKAELTVEWKDDNDASAFEYTYDTNEHGVKVTVTPTTDAPVSYDVTYNTTSGGKPVNAGSYTATLNITNPDNYELKSGSEDSQDFTIAPAVVTATELASGNAFYDGKPHVPTIEVKAAPGSVQPLLTQDYKIEYYKGTSTTAMTGSLPTEADNYKAEVVFTSGNFALPSSATSPATFDFTIAPGVVTAQLMQDKYGFTNSPIDAKINVYLNGVLVTDTTAYTITNGTQTVVGPYEATVAWNGATGVAASNYDTTKMTTTFNWEITQAGVIVQWKHEGNYDYDGEENKKPGVATVMTTNGVELFEDPDDGYVIAYSASDSSTDYKNATTNGTTAIKYTATVTLGDNIKALYGDPTITQDYYINKAELHVDWPNVDQVENDGEDHLDDSQSVNFLPVITGTGAVKDTDYTVTFKNGAGAPADKAEDVDTYTGTVALTDAGKKNYDLTGITTATFKIVAAPADVLEVTLDSLSLPYNGAEQEPAVTVKLNGTTLDSTTDYTTEYLNNKNVGLATVIVSSNSSAFEDTAVYFNITKDTLTVTAQNATKFYGMDDPVEDCFTAEPTTARPHGTPDIVYEGSLKREDGEGYGTYNFLSKGTLVADNGNYEIVFNANSAALTIEKDVIETNDVDSTYPDTAPTYDGKEHIPTFEITGHNNGITLEEGKDYTITYTKNGNQDVKAPIIDAGVYNAKVKLINPNYESYVQDVNYPFTIAKDTLTIVWSDPDITYDGKEHTIEPDSVTATKAPVSYSVAYTDADDKTVEHPTAAGEYKATLTVDGYSTDVDDSNYTLANGSKLVQDFTIQKVAVTVTELVPVGTIKYDGEPHVPKIDVKATAANSPVQPARGTDYRVAYYDENGDEMTTDLPTDVGEYSAEVIFPKNGNFTSDDTALGDFANDAVEPLSDYEIEQAVVKAELVGDGKYAYTGNEIIPDIRVTLNGVQVASGYTIKYDGTDNTTAPSAAGTHTATVTWIGDGTQNYDDTDVPATIPYQIINSGLTVVWDHTGDYTYNGESQKPGVSSIKTSDNKTLVEQDGSATELYYTVEYAANGTVIDAAELDANTKNATDGTDLIEYTATIVLSNDVRDQYVVVDSQLTQTYHINKANLYVSWPNVAPLVYDRANHFDDFQPTVSPSSAVIDTDYTVTFTKDSGSTAVDKAEDAGTYTGVVALTRTAPDKVGAYNYNLIGIDSASYTIGAKDITLTWADTSAYVYDGTEHKPEVEDVDDSNVALNSITVDWTGHDPDCIEPGAYTATASIDGGNYNITNPELKYTVAKATVSITDAWLDNDIYNATAKDDQLKLTVEVTDPDPTAVTLNDAPTDQTAFDIVEIGEGILYGDDTFTSADYYPIKLTLKTIYQKKYQLAKDSETVIVEIKPITVTVTAEDKTKYAGTRTPILTYEVTGNFVDQTDEDDVKAAIASTISLVCSDGDVAGKTYPINIIGAETNNPNYEIETVPGTLTVNAVPDGCTVEWKDNNTTGFANGEYVYNGDVQYPTAADVEITLKDANGNDEVVDSSKYTLHYSNKNSKNAGDYAVTVIFENEPRFTWDQDLVYTIAPKSVTVTAKTDSNLKEKVYGDADPDGPLYDDFTSKLATADQSSAATLITGDLKRAEGEDVGKYKLTIGDLSAGDNYELSFTENDKWFEIKVASLSIKANDATMPYGGPVPTNLTATITGLKNGDTEADIEYTLGTDATTTSPITDDTHTYKTTVTPAQPSATNRNGNYDINPVAGVMTVTAIEPGDALTVALKDNAKFVYDGTAWTAAEIAENLTVKMGNDPVDTYTIKVTKLSTNANLSRNAASLDDTGDTMQDAGSYNLAVTVPASGNYTAATRNLTATVDPVKLVLTPNNATKNIDAADPAYDFTVAAATGYTLPDGVTAVALHDAIDAIISRTPTDESAGDKTIYIESASFKSGSSFLPGNYDFTFATGTLTIQEDLAVVWTDTNVKIYKNAEFATNLLPQPKVTVGGTDITLDIECFPTTVKNAGDYVAKAKIPASATAIAGRQLSNDTCTFTVYPAKVSAKLQTATKMMGDPDPTTYRFDDFSTDSGVAVPAEVQAVISATAKVTRTAGEDVGDYPLSYVEGSAYTGDPNFEIGTIHNNSAVLTITDSTSDYNVALKDGKANIYYDGAAHQLSKSDITVTKGTGASATTVPADKYEIETGTFTAMDDTYKNVGVYYIKVYSNDLAKFPEKTLIYRILPVTLTVAWTVDSTGYPYAGTYTGGPTAEVTVTTPASSSVSPTSTVTLDPDKNVGDYKVATLEISSPAAGNYVLANGSKLTQLYKIKKRIATVDLSQIRIKEGREYNGTVDAMTLFDSNKIVFGNRATGETASDVYIEIESATFANPDAADDKPVTVILSELKGTKAGNYTYTRTDNTAFQANITKKALTIKADDKTKTYGDANPPLTVTMTGLVATDSPEDIYYSVTTNVDVGTDIDASDRAITVTAPDAQDNYKNKNYTITKTPGAFTITKREVVIGGGIVADNKPYDGTDAATLNTTFAQIEGLINGDKGKVAVIVNGGGTFTEKNGNNYTPSATISDNKYVLIPYANLALTGDKAKNYKLAPDGNHQSVATGMITEPTITIEGVAAAQVSDKEYDGTPTATVNYTNAIVKINGVDSTTAPYGLALNTSVTPTANFVVNKVPDKNVAYDASKNVTTKDVVITGFTLKVASGSGTVDPIFQKLANDYVLEIKNAATITPRYVTVTDGITAVAKDYNGNLDAELDCTNATIHRKVDGDKLTVSGTGTYLADGVNKIVQAVINQPLTLSGDDAPNYTYYNNPVDPPQLPYHAVTQQYATGEIRPKDVTIKGVVVKTKTYDGTTAAELDGTANVQLDGVYDADASKVSLTPETNPVTFVDRNAGKDKPVVLHYTLSGTYANRYNLVAPNPAFTGTIDPATLTVATGAVTTQEKVYDGNADAELTVVNADGLVGVFENKPTADPNTFTKDDVHLEKTDETNAKFVVVTSGTATPDKNVADPKDVQVYKLGLTGDEAGNYILTQPTLSAKITVKHLIPDVIIADKEYDANADAHIQKALLIDVVPGDDVTLDASKLTAKFAKDNSGTLVEDANVVLASGKAALKPILYNVSATDLITGGDADNYIVDAPTDDFAIIYQAPLSIHAKDVTKVYGTAYTFTDESVEFIGKKAAADTYAYSIDSTGKAANANVGTYPITVTPDTTTPNNNYYISTQSGVMQVIPRTLTVVADNKPGVEFGDPIPELTFKIFDADGTTEITDTFKDNFDGFLTSEIGKANDTADAVGSFFISNANNTLYLKDAYKTNYAFTVTPGVLTVGGKVYGDNGEELTITVTGDNYIYDGTEKKPTVSITAKTTGATPVTTTLVEGTHYTVDYDSNINAGVAKVFIRPINGYTFKDASGAEIKTYTKTFRIKQRVLIPNWPANTALTYNGEQQVLTIDSSNPFKTATADTGVVDGEAALVNVYVTGNQLDVDNGYVATAHLNGEGSSNYTLDPDKVNQTFSIVPAEVTVTLAAMDAVKQYYEPGDKWVEPSLNWVTNGAENSPYVVSVTTPITGDVVTLVLSREDSDKTHDVKYDNGAVAPYDVTVESYSVTNAGIPRMSKNYTIVYANSQNKTALTINPKPVTPYIWLSDMDEGNDPGFYPPEGEGNKRGYIYDSKTHMPAVLLTVDDQRTEVIPASEYNDPSTVAGQTPTATDPIAATEYTVVVTDKENFGNYTFTSTKGNAYEKFKIYEKEITAADIEWGSLILTYTGETQWPTATVKGFDPDKFTVAVGYGYSDQPPLNANSDATSTGAQKRQGALTYIAHVTGINYKGSLSGNFKVPDQNPIKQEFFIIPAEMTITPDAGQEKVFGDPDYGNKDKLTYKHTDWLKPSTETEALLEGALSRDDGEHAGEYAITMGTLKETSGNYKLVLADPAVMFKINPRPIEVSTEAIAQGKIDLSITGWNYNSGESRWETTFNNAKQTPKLSGVTLKDLTIVDATLQTVPLNVEYIVEPTNPDSKNAGEYTFRILDNKTPNPEGDFMVSMPYDLNYKILPITLEAVWTKLKVYNTQIQYPGVTLSISDTFKDKANFKDWTFEVTDFALKASSTAGYGSKVNAPAGTEYDQATGLPTDDSKAYEAKISSIKIKDASGTEITDAGVLASFDYLKDYVKYWITPKPIKVENIVVTTVKDDFGVDVVGKVYDGTREATLDLTGFDKEQAGIYAADKDNVEVLVTGEYSATDAIGEQIVHLTYETPQAFGGTEGYNYVLDNASQDKTSGTIVPKKLTVTAVTEKLNKEYLEDEPVMSLTNGFYTVDGFITTQGVPEENVGNQFVNGEASALSRKGVGGAAWAVDDPVGTYPMTLGDIALIKPNYKLVLLPENCEFTINPRGDSGSHKFTIILDDKDPFTYTGEKIEPKFHVYDDLNNDITNTPKQKNYKVAFENNIDVTTDTVKAKIILTPADDADKSNYTVNAEYEFKISKAPLVLKITGAEKNYLDDDPDPLGTVEPIGLLAEDKLTASTLERAAGTDAGKYALTLKSYEIKADRDVGGTQTPTVITDNYDVKVIYNDYKGDFTINPRPVKIDTLGTNYFYTPKHWDYTGDFIKPEVSLKDDKGNEIPAKEYNVNYDNNVDHGTGVVILTDKDGANEGNYDITFAISAPLTFEIDQAVAELKWTDDSVTFDGKWHLPTAEVSNLKTRYDGSKDVCDVIVVGQERNVGTYFAQAASLSNNNYKLSTDFNKRSTEFTIEPKEVTVTGIKAYDKVYDGYTVAKLDLSKAEFTGALAGDKVELVAIGEFEDKNAGKDKTVKITARLEGLNGDNYTVKSIDKVTATITPAKLTIEAMDCFKVYKEADPTPFEYHAVGFKGEDTKKTVMKGELTREGVKGAAPKQDDPIGKYKILQGTLSAAPNYELEYNEGYLYIGKSDVEWATVVVEPAVLIYNGKARTVENGDIKVYVYTDETKKELIPDSEYTLLYKDNKDVGTATITVLDTNNKGNYKVIGTATFEIVPATLTVTADDLIKVYGDPDPVLTYKVEGLQGTDTADAVLTGALVREKAGTPEGENVGVYAITQGTLAVVGINYKLTFVPGTLTIVARKLTIKGLNVTINDVPRTYDGTKQTPPVTVTVDGVVIPSVEYTVTYENNINAGVAEVELADVPGGNYDLTFDITPKLTFDILPREIGIVWAPLQFIYDGQLHVPTATATGLIGDDICLISVSYNGVPIPAGTYTAFATDVSNKNYRLPENNKTEYVILPRDVEVHTTDVILSKKVYTYNGKEHRPTVTVIVDGQVMSPTEYTVSYLDNIHAGTATVVLKDAPGGNYTLNFNLVPPVTFTIRQRTAKLAWAPLTFEYDGEQHLPEATVTNLVKGDECKVTVKPEGEKAINIGTYYAKATKLSNKDYKLPTKKTKKFKIVRPAIDGTLILKMMPGEGGKSIDMTWTKITNVDGYDIFMCLCNSDGVVREPQFIASINNNKTFNYTVKDLKKQTCYKAYVKAFIYDDNGDKMYVRSSLLTHCISSGTTRDLTNPGKLTLLTPHELNLEPGETITIEGIVEGVDGTKTLLHHTSDLRFVTSYGTVATVNKHGKVTAVRAGTCTITVITNNGLYDTVKVKVR